MTGLTPDISISRPLTPPPTPRVVTPEDRITAAITAKVVNGGDIIGDVKIIKDPNDPTKAIAIQFSIEREGEKVWVAMKNPKTIATLTSKTLNPAAPEGGVEKTEMENLGKFMKVLDSMVTHRKERFTLIASQIKLEMGDIPEAKTGRRSRANSAPAPSSKATERPRPRSMSAPPPPKPTSPPPPIPGSPPPPPPPP